MGKLASFLLILSVVAVMVAWAAPPAAAQYTNVAGLEPWSAQSNYMSLAGYLRWTTFKDQGVWLSMLESKRIVAEQLAQP
ncbi:MAG: hypothetical protein OEV33_06075 [Armatimonadota bacterium]|nr:hypothetical protein [Armatimonadota bacterium]